MEARGLEFIESNLSAFMAGAMHILAKDRQYSGCRNILQIYYQKDFKDDIGRVMYMGNWLTDNSQLFAPDFFFDFKYNLPDHLQNAENTILLLQQKLTLLFDNTLLASQKNKILPILNKTLTATRANIKTVRKNANQNKPKPQEFTYAKKDEWWEVAQSIIKLLGYRKFCMTKEKPLSDEVYMSIVSSFIDQNTTEPSKYLFKLNQYYPADHLDRNLLLVGVLTDQVLISVGEDTGR